MSLRPVMQQVLAKAQYELGNYKQLTKENQMNKPTKLTIATLIADYAYKYHESCVGKDVTNEDLCLSHKAILGALDQLIEQPQVETKLPEARAKVFDAIGAERYYQEMKWGDLVDHPQSVGAYLTLMRVHLARAENAWAGANNDLEALNCLRKVLAIGVACGEQHGLPKRDFNNYPE